ncbi:hypothetical protein LEP1GSC166_1444 [Leptospira kirschneri]|nr:hypothetical protein LEP1GSC166_1444 [Leptospira kirschneri]
MKTIALEFFSDFQYAEIFRLHLFSVGPDLESFPNSIHLLLSSIKCHQRNRKLG